MGLVGVLLVKMTNLSLLLLLALLSSLDGLVRDCTGDEECVLASNCTQYTEDSEDLGFLDVNSEEYDEIQKGLDDQICAVNKRTGKEKVCCRNELELDDLETSGGTRPITTGSFGGSAPLPTNSSFSVCSPIYHCKKKNRAGRNFCCRPHTKRSSRKRTCSGAKRCYAL